jgi:hypothetical protein
VFSKPAEFECGNKTECQHQNQKIDPSVVVDPQKKRNTRNSNDDPLKKVIVQD